MPLNQTLYDALCRRFGSVAIANEGEAMVTRTIEYEPGEYRLKPISSGEYLRVNCPNCRDTRKRLWINHRFGTEDPYTGRRMLYLARCYNEDCLSKPGAALKLYDMIFGFINANQRRRMVIKPGRVDEAPAGPKPPPGDLVFISQLPPDHPAVRYLVHERRFSPEELDHYGVALCTRADPRYQLAQGRMAVPFFKHGELMGWQARFIGTPPDRTVPKYYSCPGMKVSQLLYNLDNARDKPFVVIVEGITDVWRVGDHAVGLLGKTMSRYQRKFLSSHWASKPIVVLLDADAQEQVRGIVNDLARMGNNPIIPVTLPNGHDPADLDRETLWHMILSQAQAARVSLVMSQ